MPRLIFYMDFEKDIAIYKKWNLRRFFGKKGFNYFLKQSYPELVGKTDKEILDYFKDNKGKIIEQTEKAGEKLKQEWEKGGEDFFKQTEEATGFKWKYKIYKCHLSSTFISGGCYDTQKGNVVSVFPGLKHASVLDTLFHELVHLHFWDVVDALKIKYNKKGKLDAKGELWDLSEIAVNYPLQKIKIKGYKAEFHIYPQHKKLWRRIKKFYNLNFKDFILKSIEENSKAPPSN